MPNNLQGSGVGGALMAAGQAMNSTVSTMMQIQQMRDEQINRQKQLENMEEDMKLKKQQFASDGLEKMNAEGTRYLNELGDSGFKAWKQANEDTFVRNKMTLGVPEQEARAQFNILDAKNFKTIGDKVIKFKNLDTLGMGAVDTANQLKAGAESTYALQPEMRGMAGDVFAKPEKGSSEEAFIRKEGIKNIFQAEDEQRKASKKTVDEQAGVDRSIDFIDSIEGKLKKLWSSESIPTTGPIAGRTLGKIAQWTGMESEDRANLRASLGRNLATSVKEQSGVQYGYRELEWLERMSPSDTDSENQAMGKIKGIREFLKIKKQSLGQAQGASNRNIDNYIDTTIKKFKLPMETSRERASAAETPVKNIVKMVNAAGEFFFIPKSMVDAATKDGLKLAE